MPSVLTFFDTQPPNHAVIQEPQEYALFILLGLKCWSRRILYGGTKSEGWLTQQQQKLVCVSEGAMTLALS